MARIVTTSRKTIAQSIKFIESAKDAQMNKLREGKAFIAESKENSDSYQRIQKVRKSIESK